MSTGGNRTFEMAPRAARLTNSMRDIGYDFPTAIADLVDNSIAAGATKVVLNLEFEGDESYVLIHDDGAGMSGNELNEALRFGSRSAYRLGDLGRFGLGLKTASLSQCRRVTVLSRRSPLPSRLVSRTLDLDVIEERDEWLIVAGHTSIGVEKASAFLADTTGTVVIWGELDRLLPKRMANNGWGRRRLNHVARKASEHLGMVFHRFINGDLGRPLEIVVNGTPVEPWDPFGRSETGTVALPPVSLEVQDGESVSSVNLSRFVLPSRSTFSSPEAFERLSGPLKWNRQQGIYVYRAGRLVQGGGWNGIRGIDEHTKLARAALDFNTDLDQTFQINVAKMRINLPPAIRQMLERPVHDLCIQANDTYRKHGGQEGARKRSGAAVDLTDVGLAIRAAALETGHLAAIAEVEATLRKRSPDLSRALGFV